MSLKKTVSVGPLETVEIYSFSNIVPANTVPAVIIKNKSVAPIRAISYWAGLIGDYNYYSYVDVYPSEVKILGRPEDLIYRYKVVVSNLSNTETAELEFVLDFLWSIAGIPSRKVHMTSSEPFEIYNVGNAVLPMEFSDAIIKNNSMANIRAVNYWSGPIGSYNYYSHIDIYSGRTEILASPPNVVYFYKVVFHNLSNFLNAELEVMSHLWLQQ
ncbi:hypothetical protein [Photorhabdus asymbiotica]|uniref:hypothetical protein n=1 Tax=Photorhabdus asymbiotica TaxID=291112 RepID=UPI003DA76545